MASYEQVLKFEKEKPQGVIRLVEANGFYRAYDHSAFLFHQVIAQHKVTRKFAKNLNQEIVYVGFPMDRLLERIGERSHKKTPRMNARRAQAVVNSSLGVLSHYASYNVRRVLIGKERLPLTGACSEDCLRYYPNSLDWALYRFKKGERK